jgi:hypothetical protein
MLRAGDKMSPHTTAFSAFFAFSALSALLAFWKIFELKKRTSELKWRHDMSWEHGGLGHLDASDREHLHFASGP